MVSEKALFIINVSLGLLSLIMILMFFGLELPNIGKAQYVLDKDEPICVVQWKNDPIIFQDLDRCCLQVREQFECKKEKESGADYSLGWSCGAGDGIKIKMNNKAFNYCRQQPYW